MGHAGNGDPYGPLTKRAGVCFQKGKDIADRNMAFNHSAINDGGMSGRQLPGHLVFDLDVSDVVGVFSRYLKTIAFKVFDPARAAGTTFPALALEAFRNEGREEG